jgi:hypothetical protein
VDAWREWAEKHWAGLGMTVSIVGALTVSIILALVFNVIVTRHDRVHSDVRSSVSDSPTSGVISL